MNILTTYLQNIAPEFMCLQEIKCTVSDFPFDTLKSIGYEAFVSGQKSYNGTALLTKTTLNNIIYELPNAPESTSPQARFTAGKTAYGFYIISVYVPNGNPTTKQTEPNEKLIYKLKWLDSLHIFLKDLKNEHIPFIIAGDFNVIMEDTDVYNPDAYRTNALMLPEVRMKMAEISDDLGLLNTLKHMNRGAKKLYSFWDYTMRSWERDAGMLIDDIFMCGFKENITLSAAVVDKEIRGLDKPSDHAPLHIELSGF